MTACCLYLYLVDYEEVWTDFKDKVQEMSCAESASPPAPAARQPVAIQHNAARDEDPIELEEMQQDDFSSQAFNVDNLTDGK